MEPTPTEAVDDHIKDAKKGYRDLIKNWHASDDEEYLPPECRKDEDKTLCCFALEMRLAVKVILVWELL